MFRRITTIQVVLAFVSLCWLSALNPGQAAYAFPYDMSCPPAPAQVLLFSARPLWSVDSSEIYIANADGSAEQQIRIPELGLPYNSYPKWSWDKKQIIFTERLNESNRSSEDIFIMCNDGSNLRRLTSDNAADSWPSFTADPNKILAVHDFGPYGSPQTEIVYLDINSGAIVENITGGMTYTNGSGIQSNEGDVRFSWDGTKLVFGSDQSAPTPFYVVQIYVMNAEAPHQITRVSYDNSFDTDASLSPDGKSVVFSGYRGITPYPPFPATGNEVHDWYIFKVDIGVTPYRETQLTHTRTDIDLVPFWRHDTNKIAFLSARSVLPYGLEIFEMDLDGSNPIMLNKSEWRNEEYQDWR